MRKIYLVLFIAVCTPSAFAQIDSIAQKNSIIDLTDEYSKQIDTLNLTVKNIIITGNKITKDYIILREMSLKEGSKFRLEKYSRDLRNIYNLGLFTKVEIIPIPVSEKEITLNVNVQERWYIFPIPQGGVDDGEYWKKLWLALNIQWDNFRGRNETVNLYGRIFYNPAVNFTYSVPWIGDKLHLFTNYNIGFSRSRNKSLRALGKTNGENTLTYEDPNYENYNFNTDITAGKYLNHEFSLFADAGYNYLRVSQYAPGRTIDINGKDRYLNLGMGFSYDSRNIREFATKGLYLRSTYTRYGFIDKALNFGRFIFESQTFLPVTLKKDYFITLASRLYTSLAIGASIPVYQHEYLGYSGNYVRGWAGKAYEGEDELTVYNEIRIPIFQPRYINAQKIPIVRNLPIINHMELRHGLFFTIIYDIGTVFDNTDRIYNVRFLSGAGIGLDVILPFGVVGRADWVFRLGTPTAGQIGLSLSAKF